MGNIMKTLKNILNKGIATTGLALVLTGCGVNSGEILSRNSGVNEEYIVSGDTYWKYAENLQREYPELNKLDTRDVYMRIMELNRDKRLRYGETVLIPVYDSKTESEK